MQLSIFKREKKQINNLRLLNNVPAVLYAKGIQNENIYLKKDELKKTFATIKPGELPTTIFTLKSEKETFKAVVKDISYFVTTYEVQHIDFMKLDEKLKISINVPVRSIGMAESKGVKLGGNFRQVMRSIKVKCLPKDLPKEFVIDVSQMDVGELKRLGDISMPKGVDHVNKNMQEVIISISKR
ncbi:MAG: 50S ribosomal protein L25 [Parachlamydiales bacterium]|jgi:large subunit ribosomal protein L25